MKQKNCLENITDEKVNKTLFDELTENSNEMTQQR